MMKNILVIILLITGVGASHAQYARFIVNGSIEYEKRVNMFAKLTRRMSGDDSGWTQRILDEYKKTQPQFSSAKTSLVFSKNASLYRQINKEGSASGSFFSNDPSVNMEKAVYVDFEKYTSVSQKKIYEESYLVSDSLRHIKWKITSEMREIAGFDCRRANAIVMDSIYVVAFYTDQIPVSGGPESFTGLPGMILGLALPHENTTWFATKVDDALVSPGIITPPLKGKKFNNAGFLKTIKETFKDWGKAAGEITKAIML